MTLGQSQVNVMSEAKQPLIVINQFAKLVRSTPRALRFYEQKGLFKPTKIDRSTGYRYYHPRQARDFMKIKLLQTFDFTLKDINTSFKRNISDRLLSEKLKKIKEEINEKQKEYNFLNQIQKVLTDDGFLQSKFKKSQLGPFLLLCTKIEHGEYDKISQYIQELYNVATKLNIKCTGREITFYVDYIYKPKDANLEIALICQGSKIPKAKLPENFYFKKYPKTKVATYDYFGPYEYLSVFYQRFYENVVENNSKVDNNSVFEMYLNGPLNTKSKFDYLTKIGFPVVI